MTAEDLMKAAALLITLIGSLFGMWRWVERRVRDAEEKAAKVASDLAAHKTYLAETYLTKQGHADFTAQIMDAISSVRGALEGLSGRIDRMYERQSK